MRIRKILNNNVVIAINDKQEEIILMGLGIGYGKKVGENVEDNKIKKYFHSKQALSNIIFPKF